MQKGCSLDGSWFQYESESQESPWQLLYLIRNTACLQTIFCLTKNPAVE
jgi:hypothetical protein